MFVLLGKGIKYKNSIRDACCPQPGEIVLDSMRYIEDMKKYKGDFQNRQYELRKGCRRLSENIRYVKVYEKYT